MGTVPTSSLEKELRSLYLRWVSGLPRNEDRLTDYIDEFRRDSTNLINRRGGQIARLGVSQGFPAPKYLQLNDAIDRVITGMQQAAVQAGIATGLNARDISKAMLKAGFEGSYNELERLARTEVVHAYWANQWHEAEDLGLVMLWGAEKGPRTCPWCIAKDGLMVEDPNIRDHPNGRCTLIPTLPSRIPLRQKGRDPHFRKLPWDGTVPQELDQILGRGMPHAMVGSLPAQRAIGGMVSQGWTSRDAGLYLLQSVGMAQNDLKREGWSQMLRALETYADEVWAGLKKNASPKILYRGGLPEVNTGLTSWTSSESAAGMYSVRNGVRSRSTLPVYKMEIPDGMYTLDLTKANPQQQEYLVLGSMRVIPSQEVSMLEDFIPIISGIMDGPTPYLPPPG